MQQETRSVPLSVLTNKPTSVEESLSTDTEVADHVWHVSKGK